MIRTHVTFRHPAEFVSWEEEQGILSTEGVGWFLELLGRFPDLQIAENLCQEDWGAVFNVRRHGKKFWIGLSFGGEHGVWLAHFHHRGFSLFQRFTSAGKDAMQRLLSEMHDVLATDPVVSEIVWHLEQEFMRGS